ncbi:metalloprotease, partial [Teratosphaeriaceae sp. CCFEE 6253]
PLTKDDMLDFFTTHFAPDSPHRSKTAIHLVAQASPESIATKTDPAEQRTKLAETLARVISQLGMQADVAALASRLEKVDVAGGDADGIVAAVGAYLKEDEGNSTQQVQSATEQAPVLLKQILPQLGIRAQGEAIADTPPAVGGEGDGEGKKKTTVVIEDVKAWKASLPLSAGPVAARQLSEFEELESKL